MLVRVPSRSSRGTLFSLEPDSRNMLHFNSAVEMGRLVQQDLLLAQAAKCMLLPEQSISLSSTVRTVLDVACGPGGWLLDLAFMRPETFCVGIDLSELTINYARSQASVQGLSRNTDFRVMDVTKHLAFPTASFDLVNARFVSEFMPKEAWISFLYECVRILRPGGILRLTEYGGGTSTSSALGRMRDFRTGAMTLAGLVFPLQKRVGGVDSVLRSMMQDVGITPESKMHIVNYSHTAPLHQAWVSNLMQFWESHKSFVLKSGVTTSEEYDKVYLHMLHEVRLESFFALDFFLTVWAQKPITV